eukprot:TRINITY_DN12862_c0_g1_i1.p1 TRINITY_DN12862_c0_g1~~TRINITY_DN12862_c0_g1_i1.p1  ORF type:complete len:213 (+),score=18.48 TRINITY_DN12862_c0_g1_i1:22-639(+)
MNTQRTKTTRINVAIFRGDNLPGKPTSFITVKSGTNFAHIRPISNNPNPIWNESASIEAKLDDMIELFVYDKGVFSNDLLGYIKIALQDQLAWASGGTWFALEAAPKKKKPTKPQGGLLLQISLAEVVNSTSDSSLYQTPSTMVYQQSPSVVMNQSISAIPYPAYPYPVASPALCHNCYTPQYQVPVQGMYQQDYAQPQPAQYNF